MRSSLVTQRALEIDNYRLDNTKGLLSTLTHSALVCLFDANDLAGAQMLDSHHTTARYQRSDICPTSALLK